LSLLENGLQSGCSFYCQTKSNKVLKVVREERLTAHSTRNRSFLRRNFAGNRQH